MHAVKCGFGRVRLFNPFPSGREGLVPLDTPRVWVLAPWQRAEFGAAQALPLGVQIEDAAAPLR